MRKTEFILGTAKTANRLFLSLFAAILLLAGTSATVAPPTSGDAHSAADQQGFSVYGGCNNSLAPFIAASVSGYNQHGNYVTWKWSGATSCSKVTSGWWWQNGRGIKIQLTHQDGRVSCKVHYNDFDFPWENTVWVTQRYDSRC